MDSDFSQVKWAKPNTKLPRTQHVEMDEPWDRTRSRQSTAEWSTGDSTSTADKKTEGWHTCAEAVKNYDTTMVKNWKEEIDTLLVFAGLFSAVITAFIIDSYKWLQEDTAQITVQLLAEISSKLSNTSLDTSNKIPQTFRPPTWAIVINVLWFSSLVAALTSAFMGILSKQWLREYIRPASISPRESVTLRQFRYQGLKSWGVIEIISLLPLMLELALVLFFAGLLELLWTVNSIVAAILSALIAVVIVFYIATTILPALPGTNCPYKSPQSWAFCSLFWRIFPQTPTKYARSSIRSWQEREMAPLLHGLMKGRTLEALLWIDKVFWDRQVLDNISSCLADMRNGYSDTAVQFVHRVMAYRAGCTVKELKENVVENNIRTVEPESNTQHPLINFHLRMDKTRGDRLRRALLESLVWQWSISAHLIHTQPVLTKMHEILATLRVLPEHQDCFDPGDQLPRKALEIAAALIAQDPSMNPLFPTVQNEALDIISYLCYRTPPPMLQEALPHLISAIRKSYDQTSIFLAAGSILTRVLGRWDITTFQNPQSHTEFVALLGDMKRYFERCNAQGVQYGDRRVGKWPRRMRVVISRFPLMEDELLVFNGVLEALEKGEELGLVPK